MKNKTENRTINIELYCRYKEKRVALVDLLNELLKQVEEKQEAIDKAIKMFDNENLNKYYYGMSYEFEINDFKEDMLNILQGEENE